MSFTLNFVRDTELAYITHILTLYLSNNTSTSTLKNIYYDSNKMKDMDKYLILFKNVFHEMRSSTLNCHCIVNTCNYIPDIQFFFLMLIL